MLIFLQLIKGCFSYSVWFESRSYLYLFNNRLEAILLPEDKSSPNGFWIFSMTSKLICCRVRKSNF
jgi:hypothetical protein